MYVLNIHIKGIFSDRKYLYDRAFRPDAHKKKKEGKRKDTREKNEIHPSASTKALALKKKEKKRT